MIPKMTINQRKHKPISSLSLMDFLKVSPVRKASFFAYWTHAGTLTAPVQFQ